MFRQIVEESSTINFHENPPSWGRVVPCRRTDKHEEANSHLHHLANAPENCAGCPREVPEMNLTKIIQPAGLRLGSAKARLPELWV